MYQDKGAAKNGPKDITKLDNVLRSLSSHGILAQTKINIMQQAAAKCPKVNITTKGVQIPSLLDSWQWGLINLPITL